MFGRLAIVGSNTSYLGFSLRGGLVIVPWGREACKILKLAFDPTIARLPNTDRTFFVFFCFIQDSSCRLILIPGNIIYIGLDFAFILIQLKLTEASKILRGDPFPDALDHFVTPGGHFKFLRFTYKK